MADQLNLNVKQEAFEGAISKLEGYVTKLTMLLGSYEQKRREIEDIWQDDDATRYEEEIDKNCRAVQEAIDATNAQIAQLRNVLEKKQATKAIIGTALDAVTAVTGSLFK
jgi:uncharacterized protein YukE